MTAAVEREPLPGAAGPAAPGPAPAASRGAEPPEPATAPAEPLGSPAPRGWYLALSAGVVPALPLGFVASALANRLAFVGWGVVAALGHALLLRTAWERGWTALGRAALALGWAALSLLSFSSLVERHGEILDLGYRALLWPVHHPAVSAAGTWRGLAGGAGLAAATCALLAWRRRSRGRGGTRGPGGEPE
jgi:hypothetical protein